MSLLELALAYAAQGWPVFPLDPRGKQPLGRLVPHGLKDASTDPEDIRRWWQAEPEANIGICTGEAFDVADLDGEDSVERFASVLREHGEDPLRFPRARTGGGGRHLFVAPTGAGNRARVLPGVDWRGKGGYIVAPGSVHPTGGAYEWLNQPNGKGFPLAPDWLLALLKPPQKTQEQLRPASGPAPENYVRRALEAEIEAVRLALEGERNDRLNRAAFSLGQLVGSGWLDEQIAEAELRAAAFRTGLRDPEVSLTIRSGLSSGKLEPRQEPATGWSAEQQGGVIVNGNTGGIVSTASDTQAEEFRSSWEPVNLAQVLAGDLSPLEPVRLPRTDGVRLLYPGRVHMFLGEPESCKSWAAQVAIAEILIHGEHAVYVDFEAEARDVVTHLQALGVPDDVILHGLSYIRPEEPLTAATRKSLLEHLQELQPKMTVVDGVNAAMVADGLEPNSNKDVGKWWREVVRPVQRSTDGPSVLIDHVAKDKEHRGDWAVGAGNKKALVDGAMIAFEVIQGFGRGRTGLMKLLLFKDRPGALRAVQGSGRELARLRLVSHPETGRVDVELMPPTGATEANETPAAWRPTGYMERISRLLEEAAVPMSKNVIESRVQGKTRYLRDALVLLVAEGYVETADGPRSSVLHRSLKSFREDPSATSSVGRPYIVPGPRGQGETDLVQEGGGITPPPMAGRGQPPTPSEVIGNPARPRAEDEVIRCPRCRSQDYQPLGNARRRCLARGCGAEW